MTIEKILERSRRIELLASDWKSEVLPLYELRTIIYLLFMLAEAVGFEPTKPCGLPHFKCGAINHALPRFRIMVPTGRLELPTYGLLIRCSTR